MHKALVFHGAIICVVSVLIFGLEGKQTRRERDEIEARRAEEGPNVAGLPSGSHNGVGSEESKEV